MSTKNKDKVRVYVYVGPTIRGVIQCGSIYYGKRTEIIDRLGIDDCSEIKTLLVEDSNVVAARKSIKNGEGLYALAYNKILEK